MVSPKLIRKIADALDDEFRFVGRYAEIAKEINDPALRSLFFGMAGDEYGHVRALAVFLASIGQSNEFQVAQVEKAQELSKATSCDPQSNHATAAPLRAISPYISRTRPGKNTEAVPTASPKDYYGRTHGWH